MADVVFLQVFSVQEFMRQLQRMGFYDFLLPWLFTFAVVYALLVKSGVFGSQGLGNKISGIVAIVVAFFVTMSAGPQLTSYFATLSVSASVILAAIVVIILFGVLIGVNMKLGEKVDNRSKSALAAVIILGAIVFLAATGGRVFNYTLGSNLGLIFVILVVVLAVAYIMSGGGKEEEDRTSRTPKTPGP